MLRFFSAALFISILFSENVFAQYGCTDPAALNYNSGATINDGSCMYAVTDFNPVLRGWLAGTISSCSAAEYTDGNLWVLNDSGNDPVIYRIDTSNGALLQTVVIDNHNNYDWEDLTADSSYIYIADCGNNNGTRTNLRILKIAKSDITASSTVHLNSSVISFHYTDQSNFNNDSATNFDCEALISIRDSLYLFTKDRGDFKTRVYKLSKTPGSFALSPIAEFDVNGMVTGADYDAVTNEVTLIGYQTNHRNNFLLILNDFNGVQFFSGNKRRINIDNGQEWQTEGIAYQNSNRYFIDCETAGNINASLYIVSKIWLVNNVQNLDDEKIIVYPNPADEKLFVNCYSLLVSEISVDDVLGRTVLSSIIHHPSPVSLDVHSLPSGIYFLQVSDGERIYTQKFFKE